MRKFQNIILDWYKKNRRDLPWRRTQDPYKILVSEVMLQQTQVSRVLPKYKEFLRAFPDLTSLAAAADKRLLKTWSGLGYWRRAKYLKQAAQIIIEKYRGKFPKDPAELERLPGIGPYTAHAVACFAFNGKDAFLDTNIRRAYLHFFFPNKKDVSDKEILKIAQQALLHNWSGRSNHVISLREWHYALFDYGATVLKDKQINRRSRHYHRQSKFDGSFRSFRTKVMKFLLVSSHNRATRKAVYTFLANEIKKKNASFAPSKVIASLLKDNLIKQSATHYSL